MLKRKISLVDKQNLSFLVIISSILTDNLLHILEICKLTCLILKVK